MPRRSAQMEFANQARRSRKLRGCRCGKLNPTQLAKRFALAAAWLGLAHAAPLARAQTSPHPTSQSPNSFSLLEDGLVLEAQPVFRPASSATRYLVRDPLDEELDRELAEAAVFPQPGTQAGAGVSTQGQTVPTEPVASNVAPPPPEEGGGEPTAKQREALQKKVAGAYKPLFFDNDFSYLNDPLYRDFHFGENLKGLTSRWGTLDIGGEQRVRYHHEENIRGFGLTGLDDEFWLTRTRLFANYRVSENLRFYAEGIHADSGGEQIAPRPIEVNRADLQNLFGEARLTENLSTRLGRQELLYGSQRLVSPLDWANTRRTFQGAKLMSKRNDWLVDGFWVQPMERVDPQRRYFSDFDSPDDQVQFYGLYGSNAKTELGTLDLYHLVLDDTRVGFRYHTSGARVAGERQGVLYEVEGAFQFGSQYNDAGHAAGMFVGGLGRKFEIGNWKPTLWGWYDYASGDRDPRAGGFHHLFPLAHKYNGLMDLFGRRNLHDLNVQLITPVNEKVNFLVWYHYFLLDKATTPYNITMLPYNLANPAASRDLGHEIDLLWTINRTARDQVQLGYSFFGAGDYYKLTPGVQSRSDAQFFYTQYHVQF
jgi:hypothetical protein